MNKFEKIPPNNPKIGNVQIKWVRVVSRVGLNGPHFADLLWKASEEVSKGAKIRNRYNRTKNNRSPKNNTPNNGMNEETSLCIVAEATSNINPFEPNEIYKPYQLDDSISILRVKESRAKI